MTKEYYYWKFSSVGQTCIPCAFNSNDEAQFSTIRFCFSQVVMVVSSDRPPTPNERIPHKTFEIPYKPGFIEDLMIRPALEENKYKIGWNLLQVQLVMCESLLNSSDILWEFKSFDLIVFDSSGPCGILVSQFLDIPSVTVVIGPPNQAISTYHMVPLSVSYDRCVRQGCQVK